ncbi:MAG: hypothetical protein LWX70_03165 [Sphingobacteriia bacterium]|nr:hypothetical protein [Sphingobacteriia bacterium]
MRNRLLLLVAGLAFLLSSCKTDFDLNAEWKDITIVYGVLDPGKSVQQVRINKAFLGSGSALEYAQIVDSIHYDTAVINAVLEEYVNNALTRTIKLKPVWVDRDSVNVGPFYNPDFPKVIVYKTVKYNYHAINGKDTTWLNPSATFKVIITNKKSGKIISSEAPLVSGIKLVSPVYNSANPQLSVTNASNVNFNLKWTAGDNGKRYSTTMRFFYKEYVPGTVDTTIKYVDYTFPTLKRDKTIQSTTQMSVSVVGSSYYASLKSLVPYNRDVRRIPYRMTVMFYVLGEEASTYLDVNSNTGGLVEDKVEYTNIDNGYGIFSAEMSLNYTFKISSTMQYELQSYFQSIDGSFIKP